MKLEDYFKINGTYELIDGVYNVKGSVQLIKAVEKLPVKFGKVSRQFHCFSNELKTLEGSPISVGGDFYCADNKLTSLEGCPTFVDGGFYCEYHLKRTKEYRQYLIMKKLRK